MAAASGVRAGDSAPDFEARTQTGERASLSQYLAAGPVVLFFFPKAMTPGCTKESCHFRDLAAEFAAAGATRLGISADSPERQAEFDRRHGLDFPLLSDPDRAVARRYGVRRPGPLFNRRTTFVIDADGRVLEVIKSEMSMEKHADRALEVLRARAGEGSAGS